MTIAFLFIALFGLLLIGTPIAISLGLASISTILFFSGDDLGSLAAKLFSTMHHYTLMAIPFFILSSAFLSTGGVARRLIRFATNCVGHFHGGLAMASVLACMLFAAVSGSSLASAVTMGRVSLPEMDRYKYHPRLATGCVAAGGTLGILIPPSTGFIIYALLTEESIGQLFLAGILPGILLTGLFMITIYLLTRMDPSIGPAGPRLDWRGKLVAVRRASSLIGIVVVVLGGIYLGVFTPVEAAAVGSFLTFVLMIVRGKMNLQTLRFCVLETIKTFAMVYLIVIGAFIFNPFLAITQLPANLAGFVANLNLAPTMILILIIFGYIVLGTFLEGFAIMVLTIPIVFPMIVNMGFDPIWFGVLLVVVLEMSLISPPLGLNVFVVKGIALGVPMAEIFRGIIPFWAAMLVCAILLIVFPQIALILPETMIR